MDSTSQVILILKLALNIAPPALYFVILGLVNSQSKPHLISSRNDWLALVCVFFPVVIYPSIVLASWGYYLLSVTIIGIIAIGLMISSPKEGVGWVIYNTSKAVVRNWIVKGFDKYDIEYQFKNSKSVIRLPKEKIFVKLSGFSLLRNVTVSLGSDDKNSNINSEISDIIEKELKINVMNVESGVNIIGPAMLVAGTSMLILPLMMMIRHIDAFVRLVSDLLPV